MTAWHLLILYYAVFISLVTGIYIGKKIERRKGRGRRRLSRFTSADYEKILEN
jgi:hypothetical protein